MKKQRTAALICAYNEEKHIRKVINECLKCISPVIVVNDGSKDNTLSEIKKTKAILINFSKNKGKGEALKKGFNYATKNCYDYVITLDGDGQHEPKEIPKFLDAIQGGPDLIIGIRTKRHSRMPYARRFSNFSTSAIVSLKGGTWIKDTQSGYRAINLHSLKKIKLISKSYDLESEILLKLMKKKGTIWGVPIKTIYKDEVSSINPAKETLRFFRSLFRK